MPLLFVSEELFNFTKSFGEEKKKKRKREKEGEEEKENTFKMEHDCYFIQFCFDK